MPLRQRQKETNLRQSGRENRGPERSRKPREQRARIPSRSQGRRQTHKDSSSSLTSDLSDRPAIDALKNSCRAIQHRFWYCYAHLLRRSPIEIETDSIRRILHIDDIEVAWLGAFQHLVDHLGGLDAYLNKIKTDRSD